MLLRFISNNATLFNSCDHLSDNTFSLPVFLLSSRPFSPNPPIMSQLRSSTRTSARLAPFMISTSAMTNQTTSKTCLCKKKTKMHVKSHNHLPFDFINGNNNLLILNTSQCPSAHFKRCFCRNTRPASATRGRCSVEFAVVRRSNA